MQGIMSPKSEPTEAATEDFEARLLAEQKRHQEEFRQFAYAVSHDLREPIRMIVSYTQLLDRRYQAQLDGDGLEFMRYILEATQRMDRLLGDLLTYSHQFRSLDQPLELWMPEGALQGAVLMMDAAVQESGAQVTNDPLPAVLFDFAQLTQLFRQLIANSIMFRGVGAAQDSCFRHRHGRRDPILGSGQWHRHRSPLSRADFRGLQAIAWPRIPGHRNRLGDLEAHRGAARRKNLG